MSASGQLCGRLHFRGSRHPGTAPGERGYLDKAQDPTGDIRLDHRDYDPRLGVLTTPDPLLAPGDPQTLNPYAYAQNNPITMGDPSGLAAKCVREGTCDSTPDNTGRTSPVPTRSREENPWAEVYDPSGDSAAQTDPTLGGLVTPISGAEKKFIQAHNAWASGACSSDPSGRSCPRANTYTSWIQAVHTVPASQHTPLQQAALAEFQGSDVVYEDRVVTAVIDTFATVGIGGVTSGLRGSVAGLFAKQPRTQQATSCRSALAQRRHGLF